MCHSENTLQTTELHGTYNTWIGMNFDAASEPYNQIRNY